MFTSYFKIAARHIARNRSYVLINVVGLGIAIACTMIAFVNWKAGNYADSFHENYDRLFRVIAVTPSTTAPTANLSSPLAPTAAADIAGIEAGIRFDRRTAIISLDDKIYEERVATVDPNFLEVFTFPLIEGKKSALEDPNQLLISQRMAEKYFPETSALGQLLTVNPNQAGGRKMVVGGVFENVKSQNSSLVFDFLTNIDYVETGMVSDTLAKWDNRVDATFVLLTNPNESEVIAEQMNRYIPVQNDAMPGDKRSSYLLQPMNDVYMGGLDVNNNWINKAISPAFYWGPWVMALMILLTACLNFTNTTISFSNKRLKEMGIRKVMGSNRIQLTLQLLGESLVICLLAAGLGILLAEFLLPRYNQMWSYVDLDLSLDYFSDTSLIPFLIGTVLLTALLGGAYPAFYISSFQPSHIFRGNTKFGGDGWLVRSLLGLQIVISLVAIIGGITFAQNAAFQENFDFGYDIDGIINVSVNDANSYEKFKNAIASNPDILGVTGSRNNLGFGNWWSNIGKLEDNRHAQVQLVGPDFFEVVGLSLIEGRPFDKNRETDYTDAVIINRKLMKQQQWESGLGQTIDMYGKKKKVIGVVEDFHPSNLFDPMSPNVFHFEKPDRFQTMKIKVPAPKMLETKTYLSETWAATFPFVPFEGYFQDETLFQSLTVTKNIAYIYLFLSIITVLLAATGLFSLVSLNFLKRAKEIAVRRVLGASPSNIAINLNKHYLLIFAIGCFLGGALGGFNAKFLMEQIFATNNGVSNNAILLSAVGICLIGALTIGGKLLNVLRTNPAETLKSE